MCRRFLASLIFVCLGLLSANVRADLLQVGDTIRFNDGPGFGGPVGGGEFQVDKKVGSSWSNDIFRTFCVELTEHISFNTAYKVGGISTKTVATNMSLTKEVAVLYSEFMSKSTNFFGSGVTYDYTNPTQHDKDATSLQEAIWSLMGWSTGNYSGFNFVLDAKALQFIAAAQNFVANNSAAANDAFAHVRILNVVDANGNNKQDQLYMVPEPTSLLVWSVIGLVVATTSVSRRRQLR